MSFDQALGLGAGAIWWEPGGEPMRMLATAEDQRRQTLAALGDRPAVRGPGLAVSPSDRDWLDMAQRPAADGAAESFRDLAVRLGIDKDALPAGWEFERIFPADLAVLDAHVEYHYHAVFDNAMVDQYHGKMRGIDYTYGPSRRRISKFRTGPLKGRVDVTEQLKYLYPFHYPTLEFIADRLEAMEDYERAAGYRDLLLARYPRAYASKLNGAFDRALAQDRLMTADEVAAFVALVPPDARDRNLQIAEAYRAAGMADMAITAYEAAFAAGEAKAPRPFERAAWLHQMSGNYDAAAATLEKYVKLDPSSLKTCDVLLGLSRLEHARNKLDGAVDAWKRAAAVDSWKNSVVQRGAFLKWVRGDREGAIEEYRRAAERYPGSDSQEWVAVPLLALGRDAEALAAAEKGLSVEITRGGSFRAKAMALRKKGDNAGAQSALEQYNGRMVHDPEPMLLLSRHHEIAGNMAVAVSCAEEAKGRASGGDLDSALYRLGIVYARTGALANAEAMARRSRARNPVDATDDMIRAEIALARKDPDTALREVEPGLRAGWTAAHGAAARAWLLKGDHAKAAAEAQAAVDHEIFPEFEDLLALGDALKAQGKAAEAKAAYERCAALYGPNTVAAHEAQSRMQGM